MPDNLSRGSGFNNPNSRSTPRRRPRGGKGSMKNKYFIIIFLPVILLVFAVSAFFIFKALSPGGNSVPASGEEDYIYVLPIKERTSDKKTDVTKDPFTGGSSSSIVLDGIVYNPKGTSMVILSTPEKSYVISAGAAIGDTGWVVSEITADAVTIEKDGKSETLAPVENNNAGGLYY